MSSNQGWGTAPGLCVALALVGVGAVADAWSSEGLRPAGDRVKVMMHFQPLVVQDRWLGQEACRMLIPADWKGAGQVDWRFHPQYPAGISVHACNPAGIEAVRFYPMLPFVAGVIHLPLGGHYLGNEVRPYPGDITWYVRQYLLPRFRPDIQAYRILAVEPMADWARVSVAAQAARGLRIPCQVQAGCVRLTYSVKDQPVEEEFFVMLDRLSMVGLHYWAAEWATSVRAAPGKLGAVRPIQLAMVSSLRLSLPWYARERQAAATCEQILYREQQTVMNISHILSRANDQITATIRSSYESRQAALDRMNVRFSEYLRGVESYRGSDGQVLQLPSGYRDAWINSRGEYVLSDNANFNPNVQLAGSWQRLQRVRQGSAAAGGNDPPILP